MCYDSSSEREHEIFNGYKRALQIQRVRAEIEIVTNQQIILLSLQFFCCVRNKAEEPK